MYLKPLLEVGCLDLDHPGICDCEWHKEWYAIPAEERLRMMKENAPKELAQARRMGFKK